MEAECEVVRTIYMKMFNDDLNYIILAYSKRPISTDANFSEAGEWNSPLRYQKLLRNFATLMLD